MRPVPGLALVTSAWELLAPVRTLQESGKAHGAAVGVYVVVCIVLVIIAGYVPPHPAPSPSAARWALSCDISLLRN